MRGKRLLIALAILLAPGVLLAPVWRLGGLGAREDDILYYLPARVFFQETLAAGHLPWLNPYNGLDRPYVADPQTAVWYPTTWLFLVLPPLWAYALGLWLHYSLAMWGMYRLLRAQRLARGPALFGGLVLAFGGFFLAHRAHFAMQHAAAWTPWIFWRLRRCVETNDPTGRLKRLAGAGFLIAGQCFAGHVQMAALTALGSLVFLAARRRFLPEVSPWRVFLARWLIPWLAAAGLFAVQWLPTLAYLRVCTRLDRTYFDFVENSWYPASALGWVLPMFFGQRTPNFFPQPYWGPSHQCEQFAYVGIVPLLLAAVAFRVGWRADPQRRAWVILALFSLLLALGLFGPICPLLYLIPGSSLFRVPARAMLLFDLALAALAAQSLHDLAAGPTPRRARLRVVLQRWTRRPLLAAELLVGVPLLLVLAVLPLLPAEIRSEASRAVHPGNPAVWVPLVIAAAGLSALGWAARGWQQPRRLGLPVLLTCLDLGLVGWTLDVPSDADRPDKLLPPEAAWLEAIRASGHRLWVATDTAGVYSAPERKLAANTNILAHIPALTDYGPLQPCAFARPFAFTPWGVSRNTRAWLENTRWMRDFDVGWILLCRSDWPPPADCQLVAALDAGRRLYRNPTAAGLAFFQDPATPGHVRYLPHGPAGFTTLADTWPADPTNPAKPPRLVIARLALPGWQVRSAGVPLPIEPSPNGLLSVKLPPGQVLNLEWSYVPPGLWEGASASALSGLVLLTLLLRKTPTPR